MGEFLPDWGHLGWCGERGLRSGGDHSLRLAAGQVAAGNGALRLLPAPMCTH